MSSDEPSTDRRARPGDVLPGFSLCDRPGCPCGDYTPAEGICEEWVVEVNRFLRCARCGAARHRHANPGVVPADLEVSLVDEHLAAIDKAIASDRRTTSTRDGLVETINKLAPALERASAAVAFLDKLAESEASLPGS